MERAPELKTFSVGEVELAVWDWPGDEPPLLFAHATGFHARCWDAVIRMIPERRSVAVDFRGHGRSGKPAPPCYWDAFGRDLAAVAGEMDLRGAIGVGHSMGGHAVVSAAFLRPETFRELLLIDPTIFRPEFYGAPAHRADFIRRRRNEWKSPEEMFERFRSRPPFAAWSPEVLRDYCRFGLLPSDGGFVLACPPEVEASIYEHSNAPEANLYGSIPCLDQPVVLVRADLEWQPGAFDLGASPTAPDLSARFRHAREVLLEGRNHYIPMESPDLVVGEIRRLL